MTSLVALGAWRGLGSRAQALSKAKHQALRNPKSADVAHIFAVEVARLELKVKEINWDGPTARGC